MRENASLHLPPEAGIDVVIRGELSSAAGETFGFVEVTEDAELAAEQAHVRAEETVLLSLLKPSTQSLEVTRRRLVISRHARDLGQSNLADPAAIELSQALVRLPGERNGFVETLEQRQRSQQQALELVGRALVEVEPVVAEHRTCEHLAGRIALGNRSLGRRLDDLCRAARVLDEQRRGEVHLEQDVEPEGPGQLE